MRINALCVLAMCCAYLLAAPVRSVAAPPHEITLTNGTIVKAESIRREGDSVILSLGEGLSPYVVQVGNLLEIRNPDGGSEYFHDKILKRDGTAVYGSALRVGERDIEFDPVGDIPFILLPRSDVLSLTYTDGTIVPFARRADTAADDEMTRDLESVAEDGSPGRQPGSIKIEVVGDSELKVSGDSRSIFYTIFKFDNASKMQREVDPVLWTVRRSV